MADDKQRRSHSASWRWFAVPALLVGLLAAVLGLISSGDDNSDGPDGPRVFADDPSGLETEPTPTPGEGLLTATSVDIDDGLVRAGRISPEPFLSVDPKVVTSPGPTEFTVMGRDWTAAPTIFILACGPEVVSFELETNTPESCDLSNLTPATPVDGQFEIVVSYDVPSGGFTIVASDPTGTRGAIEFVHVG